MGHRVRQGVKKEGIMGEECDKKNGERLGKLLQ